MTSSSFSEVNTQYRVSTLRRVCFVRKVAVKSTKSGMILLSVLAQ